MSCAERETNQNKMKICIHRQPNWWPLAYQPGALDRSVTDDRRLVMNKTRVHTFTEIGKLNKVQIQVS